MLPFIAQAASGRQIKDGWSLNDFERGSNKLVHGPNGLFVSLKEPIMTANKYDLQLSAYG